MEQEIRDCFLNNEKRSHLCERFFYEMVLGVLSIV